MSETTGRPRTSTYVHFDSEACVAVVTTPLPPGDFSVVRPQKKAVWFGDVAGSPADFFNQTLDRDKATTDTGVRFPSMPPRDL
jgi:hypothetical protein